LGTDVFWQPQWEPMSVSNHKGNRCFSATTMGTYVFFNSCTGKRCLFNNYNGNRCFLNNYKGNRFLFNNHTQWEPMFVATTMGTDVFSNHGGNRF
jgi:hypothetical protein